MGGANRAITSDPGTHFIDPARPNEHDRRKEVGGPFGRSSHPTATRDRPDDGSRRLAPRLRDNGRDDVMAPTGTTVTLDGVDIPASEWKPVGQQPYSVASHKLTGASEGSGLRGALAGLRRTIWTR